MTISLITLIVEHGTLASSYRRVWSVDIPFAIWYLGDNVLIISAESLQVKSVYANFLLSIKRKKNFSFISRLYW